MKESFVLIVDYTEKRESGFCLENAAMFQIQDIFENGKPNIILNGQELSYKNFDF